MTNAGLKKQSFPILETTVDGADNHTHQILARAAGVSNHTAADVLSLARKSLVLLDQVAKGALSVEKASMPANVSSISPHAVCWCPASTDTENDLVYQWVPHARADARAGPRSQYYRYRTV